jgi:hypothetical protein
MRCPDCGTKLPSGVPNCPDCNELCLSCGRILPKGVYGQCDKLCTPEWREWSKSQTQRTVIENITDAFAKMFGVAFFVFVALAPALFAVYTRSNWWLLLYFVIFPVMAGLSKSNE